jgi:hypothetical protein
LLRRKLMGTTVLESGVPVEPGLHVYAHCRRDGDRGVAVLALNTDRAATRTLAVPAALERFALTAHALDSRTIELNGRELKPWCAYCDGPSRCIAGETCARCSREPRTRPARRRRVSPRVVDGRRDEAPDDAAVHAVTTIH